MPSEPYPNPPITEALIEFQFVPGDMEWDLTVPGRMWGKLHLDYPSKPTEQSTFDFDPDLPESDSGLSEPSNSIVIKVLFSDESDSRKLAIGKNLLSVHILNPYEGWSKFSKRTTKALSSYWEELSPIGVRRIVLRYLNHIVVPQTKFILHDYFPYAPTKPTELPDTLSNFITKVEFPYEEGGFTVLTITPIRVNQSQEKHKFLFDLELVWIFEDPIGQDEVLAKVEILRERERVAFESYITDKTRGLFK
jgi:uncharacterized protein (TIGR04255 family)